MERRPATKTLKKLIIAAIYISALSLFAIQVRDVFQKYLEKKTTVSISQRTRSDIQLPIITLCSDPKLKTSGPFDFDDFLYKDIGDPSMFDSLTFKLGRDFELALELELDSKAGIDITEPGLSKIIFDDDDYNGNRSVEVLVTEISSPANGLCYAIEVNLAMRETMHALELEIGFTEENRQVGFKAIIANMTAFTAVMFDDWHGLEILETRLKLHKETLIGLSQTTTTLLEETGHCKNYGLGDSKAKCVFRTFNDVVKSKIVENCDKLCGVPALKILMDFDNEEEWEYFKTLNETTCVADTVLENYKQMANACPEPCVEVVYSSKTQTDAMMKGMAMVVYFDSMTEQVYEELLLFDGNSFIGNIGGSLGLFVGFSYLDFATSLTSKMIDFFVKPK